MTFYRGARIEGHEQPDKRLVELGGVLHVNTKGGSNSPDYFGSVCIGGVEYTVRAYWQVGEAGKYIKLRLKAPE